MAVGTSALPFRPAPSTTASVLRWARRVGLAALLAVVLVTALGRRHELAVAVRRLDDIRPVWLLVAGVAEAASILALALLQRRLLRAAGAPLALRSVGALALAGNAIGRSLPGGGAWSAAWMFRQLRVRGATRLISGWVILVAGALSSFALFLVVAGGAALAGSRGPVAGLRLLAAALAAIPVVAAAGALVVRHRPARAAALRDAWERTGGRFAPGRLAARAVTGLAGQLRSFRPGVPGWIQALGFALANWVCDAVCLAAAVLALGAHVPWRGLLVAYGLAQIAASLPITPGGIGVVEGSLTALLVAYGMSMETALAATLLYRVVSFWGLVPVGWTAWGALEVARREQEHRMIPAEERVAKPVIDLRPMPPALPRLPRTAAPVALAVQSSEGQVAAVAAAGVVEPESCPAAAR